MQFFNDLSDLAKHSDVTILPLEYGGKMSKESMIEEFREQILDAGKFLSEKINMYEIDKSKVEVQKDFSENFSGSFRKLEID